jgi:DNA-directed RNA polymerase specialized sigma24 family protein
MPRSADSSSRDSLKDLVQRAQAGDRSAVERLAAHTLVVVRRLVRGKIGPELKARVDEEDMVQTAVFEVIRDLKKVDYRGPKAFFRWVEQVVRHKIYDKAEHFHSRKRDRRREKTLTSGDDTLSSKVLSSIIAAKGPGPLSVVRQREEQERVRRSSRTCPTICARS